MCYVPAIINATPKTPINFKNILANLLCSKKRRAFLPAGRMSFVKDLSILTVVASRGSRSVRWAYRVKREYTAKVPSIISFRFLVVCANH